MSVETIPVKVSVPWAAAPVNMVFVPSTTVGDAATAAFLFWKRPCERPSFADADGVVLDRSLTLAEAGVTDSSTVELVDVGGAV